MITSRTTSTMTSMNSTSAITPRKSSVGLKISRINPASVRDIQSEECQSDAKHEQILRRLK
jgi:hypothetical protein